MTAGSAAICILGSVIAAFSGLPAEASSPKRDRPEMAGIVDVPVGVIVDRGSLTLDAVALERQLYEKAASVLVAAGLKPIRLSPQMTQTWDIRITAEVLQSRRYPEEAFIRTAIEFRDQAALARMPKLRLGDPVVVWQWWDTTAVEASAVADSIQSAVERGVGFFAEEVRYQTSRTATKGAK